MTKLTKAEVVAAAHWRIPYDAVLTTAEVAEALHKSVKTVRRMDLPSADGCYVWGQVVETLMARAKKGAA